MKIDIENKILIPFLLLIIIPTLVVGGVFYWNSNQLFAESRKATMAEDLLHIMEFADTMHEEVAAGSLSRKQAQDKVLNFIVKGWKDSVFVFDKDSGLYLTGSGPAELSFLSTRQGVWFKNIESRINAFVQYENWNWLIGMSYDTREFTRQLLELQKYTLLIAIIGIIVAVEFSIFIAHSISRPIKKLAEICDEITMGSLEAKVPLNRTDEIGILAGALNNMLQRLQENNKKLETMKKANDDILRCIDVGIITINKEGAIIGINQAAQNLINGKYAVDENGRYVGDLLTLLREILAYTVMGKEPVRNLEWKVEDGEQSQYLVVTTGLLRSEEGSVTGAICSFSDITQRKKVEERIERVHRMVSLGELAAGLAHEIRNPLAGIKTSSQVLQSRFQGQESNKKLIDGILFEIDRLNMLIADLLNFAHPRPADRANVDIVPVIQRAVELTENERRRNNIKLELVIDTPDSIAFIDQNQMEQVFLNIIINAVKAMKDGGLLTIRVYRKEDSMFRKLKVAFSDTGVGIDNEIINRIFDPFFTTDPGGTGLGLSVVHKLVTENEGDIEVNSKLGQGTTFVVGLPGEV